MEKYKKYKRGYYLPPEYTTNWVNKEYIDKAPVWCSVDLRDGNQALVTPMSLDEKLEFYQLLLKIGFKEIEVGFPAASETEYQFVRTLIEQDFIPDDVTIQVLTQAREKIIRTTFDAIQGAKNVVVHMYNSTSFVQRQQVFKKSKEEIIELAVEGAKLMVELGKNFPGNLRYEYSPESFTGTEIDFALEISNKVMDVLKPTKKQPTILNLPVTVEMSLSHIYATQVEYICKNLKNRENIIVSLHPHNDRGTAVADTELGLLAGADRVEGTLFGNGERTGNVDIITLALNMYSHGVDPKIDLSNMPEIVELYEQTTKMRVYERHPYSGELVFAAFSGSHQDAIAKGMTFRADYNESQWTVPYLPIDPTDLSRNYEADVIRINSQSGKGGISYILLHNFGIEIPQEMREDIGYAVKHVSDIRHKELMPDEVYNIFNETYVNKNGKINVLDYDYKRKKDIFEAEIKVNFIDKIIDENAIGTGRLDSFNNAIKKIFDFDYKIVSYKEYALEEGATSKAIAYVCIEVNKQKIWGVGIDNDIIAASINALISALNRKVN